MALSRGEENVLKQKWPLASLVLTIAFVGWFVTLIPWIMPIFYFG